MKRSEILKIIVKELDKNYDNKGLETAGIAHDILFRIEKAGINPPNRHRCFSHDCEHGQDNSWDKE